MYKVILNGGAIFSERTSSVALIVADGSTKIVKLLFTNVDITIGNLTLPIAFCVFPDSQVTRTLLGVELLEQNGMILNLPQRSENFIRLPRSEIVLCAIEELL